MNDISVKIVLSEVVGKTGFGYPLILSTQASTAIPYTVCATLQDVVKAGYEATTDVYKAAQLMLMQAEPPAKFAVCSIAGKVKDASNGLDSILHNEWRQAIVTTLGTEGGESLKEVAEYFETLSDKMLFAHVSVLSEMDELHGLDRTVALLYPHEDHTNPEAALVGATAGRAPGSFTYKNMILKGITPSIMSSIALEDAHEAGCIAFVTKAGDNVTSEGKTVGGEYVDIIDSKDYVIQQIGYKSQKLLNEQPKLSYDNNGISALEGVVLTVLKDAYVNGIIAENDEGTGSYSVTFASRSEVDPADRATRVYKGGKFKFELAGAIHTGEINGEIIV